MQCVRLTARAVPSEASSTTAAKQQSPVSPASPETSQQQLQPTTACQDLSQDAGDIVLAYYKAWNVGDIDTVIDCFAEEAVYHDAIYLEPFFGKQALRKFFGKFSATPELQALKFVITECSHGDALSCGVAWCASFRFLTVYV